MIKREAKMHPTVTAYIKIKKIHCYWELKQTRTGTFSLKNFEPQQIESLLSANYNGICYKLSDADPRIKPFDGFNAPPLPAYVVIRYPKDIFFIHVFNINVLINNGIKSISTRYAKELSDYHIAL